jgi:hypothetical protein
VAAGTLLSINMDQFSSRNGNSATETDTLYYWLYQRHKQFLNELHVSFALDDTTISTVTGYNPGTYENVWLLPKSLVSSSTSIVDCAHGPILATVEIGSSGECTSITPTMKNGGYYAGETLLVMLNTASGTLINEDVNSDIGTGSADIEVNVLTSSDSTLNLAGCAFWAYKSSNWTSTKKGFSWASDRLNVLSDSLYVVCHQNQNATSTGGTVEYMYYRYDYEGWDDTYGRGTEDGSTASLGSHAMYNPGSAGSRYSYYYYYNTTVGSELYCYCDSYNQSVGGLWAIDKTNGFIGERLYSSYAVITASSSSVMAYQANVTNDVYGYGAMTIYKEPEAPGYFKPWPNAQSNNFIVGGSNENMYAADAGTPFMTLYSSSDQTVNFRFIGSKVAVRV